MSERPNLEKIAEALRELETAEGKLDPEQVVAFAASNPDSPLHGWFTWDDSEAARRYRLNQARDLIRTVKITITVRDHKLSAPAYVRDPDESGQSGVYRSIHHVKSDEEMARDVMIEEMKRIANAVARAHQIASFFEAEEPLREIQRIVSALAARVGFDNFTSPTTSH
jgi:hypothetical protein